MAEKCTSSAEIRAGSALAAKRDGRLNALMVRSTWSALFCRPTSLRQHRGLAASPMLGYRLIVEEVVYRNGEPTTRNLVPLVSPDSIGIASAIAAFTLASSNEAR